MPKDYYAPLGLSQGASLVDIRVAYRRLAARYHPDKFSSASAEEQAAANLRMVELNEAMSILGNVDKRSVYDRELKAATFSALRPRRREPPKPVSQPRRAEAATRAWGPRPAPETTRLSIEKRVAALREQIQSIPLKWKNLTLPAWAWSFESNDSGRPLFIAHQHLDSFELKDIHSLDKAIDRVLGERKERLRSPWIVILLSCKRLSDPSRLSLALDTVAKRSRGWLKKRPMILLYAEGAGRVMKLGQKPEHDHMDRIMNMLLHP